MESIELKMLQALPLEVKIMKSKARIEEWYRYWGGKVYISFSGGKDSTVLLHLVRSLYPDVQAVFVDTGLEYPEIKEFVKSTNNVIWVRPKMAFNKVIEKYGYPVISKEQSHYIYQTRHTKSEILRNKHLYGIMPDGSKTQFTISNKWKYLLNAPFEISDHCCSIMKKAPVKKYEKQTGHKAFLGTMTDESTLREKKYLKNGCNSFEGNRPLSTPLGFWKEQDIYQYIHDNKLEIAKVYGELKYYIGEGFKLTGVNRTGCMFCMYGVHLEKGENRFQRMQKTHPKQHEYCMRDTSKGGLGLAEVLDYINVPYTDNLVAMKTSEGIEYQQYKIV